MTCISVNMLAKKGSEDDLLRTLEHLAQQSRKEPGCVMYQVHRSNEDRRRFFLYEQYQNMAAVEAHRAAPHYKSHALELIPALIDERSVDLWETTN